MPAEVVKFDEFELDCNRYELLRAGRRIKLEKLPMELLILLIEKKIKTRRRRTIENIRIGTRKDKRVFIL